MQETEISNDLNHYELSVSDYSIELEKKSSKSRIGFYVSKSVSYVRRCDLEGSDSNLIVIDLEGTLNTRLINIYRSFAPQNGISQRDKFKYQLTLIKNAICNMNCILLGDFNLNYTRRHDVNYSHAKYFEDFDDVLYDKNLIQLIEFPTWSRIVNNVLMESVIDHIYIFA